MAEIGKATIKVVPDTSGFAEALNEGLASGKKQSGFDFFWTVAGLILLACAPAFIWFAYGWAF